MEETGEFVDKLVQLFCQALSNDDSIRENATQEIEHLLESNILLLIEGCVSIINSGQAPLKSQKYSFVILCRIFRPTTEMPIHRIKEHYKALSEEMKYNIRSAFLGGLLFQQQEIYNQAAFLISLIIVIDESSETIENILNLLRDMTLNGEYSESSHYASIMSFREIYSSGHIDDLREKFNNFDSFLKLQKDDCYEFLKFGFKYPVSFITEVVKTLNELVNSEPGLFDNETDLNTLYDIFELMFPNVFDEDLFYSMYLLLYTITKKLYNSENLNIEKIIMLTSNGISCDNPKFVSISIDFWNTIAYKEKDIIENNFILEKFNKSNSEIKTKINNIYINIPYHQYCIKFAEKSITDVLDVLTQINFDDFNADDPSFKQPYMYATSLLKKLFFIEPSEVFKQVDNLFETSVNSDNWVIQHAFLMALSALSSDQRYDYINNIRDDIEDLFKRSTNFIIQCTQSENDILSDSALFALESIASNYLIYSNEVTIPQMLLVLKPLLNRKNTICERAFKFLNKMIDHKEAPVDDLFDDLIEFSSSALNREDFKSKEIFVSVFSTFQVVIQNCTKNSIELIKKFLKNSILTYLKDVVQAVQSQEITHMMEQTILNTIIPIFKKFYKKLDEEGVEVTQILINILESVSGHMFVEDILLVLAHVIPSLNDEVLEMISPKLFEYNQKAVDSNSPRIICNSFTMISNLYRTNPTIVIDKLSDTIDLILGLKNQDFTSGIYPEIAKNFSTVIYQISKKTDFFDPEIRDKMYDIYNSMQSLNLDFDDDDGNDFANLVLESTLSGFANIILFSTKESDKLFLKSKEMWRSVFQPAVIFEKFKEVNKIKENTLMAFLELIYIFIQNTPNMANVLIKRELHFKMIVLAMSFDSDKLAEKAEKVYKLYSAV